MVNNEIFDVEVVYATSADQCVIPLKVAPGSTIEAVIKKSGITKLFSDIDLTQQKVGVFSKPRKLTDLVKDGDRVEIYRALIIDPMESRRKRARED